MSHRLGARIALTLAVNLLLLAALAIALVSQQTNAGLDSFLYSPARERVRELGRAVEEDFGALSPGERDARLAELQEGLGVELAVYEETGRLAAGPELGMPAAVQREVTRAREEPEGRPNRPRGRRQGPQGPRLFLVKEANPARIWIGYHFPVAVSREAPPVRHTLAVVAASLLTNPFLFDWRPWVGAMLAALGVSVLCWWPLARRLGGSLRALRAASAEIAEGRFAVRIPVDGRDELGELGRAVQRMAGQLARLVNGERLFLADVAHELCAPLSRLQLSAGIMAQRLPAGEQVHVERLERDIAAMSKLVGDLVSFTRGTARAPLLETLDPAAVVGEVLVLEQAAERIANEIPGGFAVRADHEFLVRALGNLMRNAMAYAGSHGTIRILGGPHLDRFRLIVQDTGPGLPETDLESVFAPFYRLDTVRTPGSGGVGLGLSIVRNCIASCGGSVHCRNRAAGGLEVVVDLPLAGIAEPVEILESR